MSMYVQNDLESSEVFVGVDVHLNRWHVTVLRDEVEIFSGSIPGDWESFRKLLDLTQQMMRFCNKPESQYPVFES